MKQLTAKEIAKKYAGSIGPQGLGSARIDLSAECEKEIIDYAKRNNEKLKKKIKRELVYILQDFRKKLLMKF